MLQLVKANLEDILAQMRAYCDGQNDHPLMEEIVLLTATHYESTEDYLTAMSLYTLLLRIQENVFGVDCEQSIKYQNSLGQLAQNIKEFGGVQLSQQYFKKAQELTEKYHKELAESMTPEEIKESKEKQASIYFNLFVASEGNQEYEEAL